MSAVPRPLDAVGATCDEPFAMLEACHGRLRRALVQMERLAARLPVHGCDAQSAQIASDILCYFDFSAPVHHEDEERHILPLLRAAGDEAFAAQIEQEHHELHRRWLELRGGIAEVASGTWVAAGPGEFVAWARFASLYRAHIAAEEAVAFPAAQALLDEAMKKAMGREMAERRGLA